MASTAFGPHLGSLSRLKANFFDRQAVQSAMDRAARQVLSRLGAYVRQRAKTSMRKGKGVSRPGQPPFVHEGSLRKLLFFAYDAASKSVIVGPLLFKRSAGTPATELLEHGGSIAGNGKVVFLTQEAGRDERGKFVSRGLRRVVLDGTIRYRPRPFMRPALQAEQSKLPGLIANSAR
ncbi:MAG: hypothetical protein KF873_01995 [Gemmataceae bacterium]|nr:hypothetical protein [Gemmataceae bacterium]